MSSIIRSGGRRGPPFGSRPVSERRHALSGIPDCRRDAVAKGARNFGRIFHLNNETAPGTLIGVRGCRNSCLVISWMGKAPARCG